MKYISTYNEGVCTLVVDYLTQKMTNTNLCIYAHIGDQIRSRTKGWIWVSPYLTPYCIGVCKHMYQSLFRSYTSWPTNWSKLLGKRLSRFLLSSIEWLFSFENFYFEQFVYLGRPWKNIDFQQVVIPSQAFVLDLVRS